MSEHERRRVVRRAEHVERLAQRDAYVGQVGPERAQERSGIEKRWRG